MTEFVFLPQRGAPRAETLSAFAASAAVAATPTAMAFLDAAATPADPTAPAAVRIKDVVPRTGAALVEVKGKAPPAVAGGALYPVVLYKPAVAEVRRGRTRIGIDFGPAGADFLTIALRSAADDAPVAGAVAVLRLKSGRSFSGVSDANGIVTFGLRVPAVAAATLLVQPGFAGHWGCYRERTSLSAGDTIRLGRIDLTAAPDALRHSIPPGDAASGDGVVVAVIDTGVGPHRDLPNATGDADTSIGHGSHVAGIIGGRGTGGLGGVAPGVTIRSYRVFNDAATNTARNFEIHRAITQAAEDGCDLINLSLKSEFKVNPAEDDPVLSAAIEEAADAGALLVAAAGNDFRRYVAFPARHPDVVAVSAFGWEPGLPDAAYDRWAVTRDRGAPDRDYFFASVSNEGVNGTNVDVTGPGVGVVSTVPGDRYAPMSGTSMACPAITGAIARLLSAAPAVMAMPRDRARADAIRALAMQRLTPCGLGPAREGGGRLA